MRTAVKEEIVRLFYHGFNAVLILSCTVWGFSQWQALPEMIPVHFGFSGAPDRWTGKGWELALIVLLPLIMTAFLYGMLALSKKYTGLINVPQKEKLLALPKERQEPFWNMLTELMAGLAATINIVFFSIIYSMVQVAFARQTGLSWMFFAALGLVFLFAIVYIVRLKRVIRECLS